MDAAEVVVVTGGDRRCCPISLFQTAALLLPQAMWELFPALLPAPHALLVLTGDVVIGIFYERRRSTETLTDIAQKFFNLSREDGHVVSSEEELLISKCT